MVECQVWAACLVVECLEECPEVPLPEAGVEMMDLPSRRSTKHKLSSSVLQLITTALAFLRHMRYLWSMA